VILLLRDVGFSLRESKAFLASRQATDDWRKLAERKLADLDEQIAKAQTPTSLVSRWRKVGVALLTSSALEAVTNPACRA
jgi:DNA-binding transcriptional MerR regulator